MKNVIGGIAVAAFVVALSAPAFAKTETVTGQVVDQSCYTMEKSNTGKDHKMPKGETKDCAIDCAKMGRPMALLTQAGKVYELTGGLAANKNAKIIPYIAQTVSVTGDVTEKDGKSMIAASELKVVKK